MSFKTDMKLAEKASTAYDVKKILENVSQRLSGADHAIAVDSAKQLLDVAISKFDDAKGSTPGFLASLVTSKTGFQDANGRSATNLDVVEYEIGARRGILLDATHDGDAYVLFRDTKEIEIVKWRQLCKVPEAGES